jgi:predicted hydrocarbon binding protein
MKADDFNLARDIKFIYEEGLNLFQSIRLVMFDVNALGLMRDEMVRDIGLERARRLMIRFGYRNGFTDLLQIRTSYKFDDETELLKAGPALHTWEGVVHAEPVEYRFDRAAGEFFLRVVWKNSYEAQQHLAYYPIGTHPVCWSLMGYASGWCSAFFGKPLLAIEAKCMGMGHDHCEVIIQPPEAFGEAAKPYLDALGELIRIP